MAGVAPEISVIVAAFNAGNSIGRCIDSILAQTFRDFELLLIDDGSTDSTGEVIAGYKDERIRTFFQQQNRGVACTRQRGLEMARGRYSIFVDADDWIEPDMLEGLHAMAVETDADMVICDIVEEFGDHSVCKKQDPRTADPQAVQWKLLGDLHAGMVNKLIRHSLYRQFNIGFLNGVNCCEDQLLLVSLLSHPLKVAYLGKAYYHYDKTFNASSITNKWHSRPVKEWILLLEAMEPYMQEADHKKAFDLYAAKRIYDSTYSGKDEEADYRLIYSRYKSRLGRSGLPLKQKIICHLRYAGLGAVIRLARQIRA